LEAGKSDLALRAVLGVLAEEGFIAKRSKQRLDSSHILGVVARLSALECVRETLALALEGLDENVPQGERPEFWEQLWERYVESKLDYKNAEEALQPKRRQAGADCLRLLKWLEPLGVEVREAKGVALLRKVFAQQYELEQSGKIEPVKVHAAAGWQLVEPAQALLVPV
jgi:transposase